MGRGGEEIIWETGIDIHTLLHIKQITNKNLLYSIRNYIQYSVMTYIETESKKRVDICVCIADSFCCTAETNTIW